MHVQLKYFGLCLHCTITLYLTASVAYIAQVHANGPMGQYKTKKVEFFVQAIKDLNREIETLEKVRTPFA